MRVNFIMLIICLGMLFTVQSGYTKEEKTIEISEEDWEIIKDIEFFEDFEIVQEDPEFLKDYDDINEINEGEVMK